MLLGGLAAGGWAARWRIAGALVGLGLAVELVQIWVPLHSASFADVASNLLGLAVALAGLWGLDRLGRRWRARPRAYAPEVRPPGDRPAGS
jgi:uncharacterized membrane protein YccC